MKKILLILVNLNLLCGCTYDDSNVHSIVYYNVPENADQYKIYWRMKKNGTETVGLTTEIPFQQNQTNEFIFNY